MEVVHEVAQRGSNERRGNAKSLVYENLQHGEGFSETSKMSANFVPSLHKEMEHAEGSFECFNDETEATLVSSATLIDDSEPTEASSEYGKDLNDIKKKKKKLKEKKKSKKRSKSIAKDREPSHVEVFPHVEEKKHTLGRVSTLLASEWGRDMQVAEEGSQKLAEESLLSDRPTRNTNSNLGRDSNGNSSISHYLSNDPTKPTANFSLGASMKSGGLSDDGFGFLSTETLAGFSFDEEMLEGFKTFAEGTKEVLSNTAPRTDAAAKKLAEMEAPQLANGSALPMDLLVDYMMSIGADFQTATELAMSFAAEQSSRSQYIHRTIRRSELEMSRETATMHKGMIVEESLPVQSRPTRLSSLKKTKPDIALNEATVVEAMPVEDPWHDPYVIYADSATLSMKHVMNERPVRRMLVIGCVLLCIVLGVVIYFVRQTSGEDSLKMSVPTMAPSSSPTFINDEIMNAALRMSGKDSLNDPTSPQFRAVSWMSTFDRYEQSIFGAVFIQRYIMAVMYYSLEGSNWTDSEQWLDPTLHECEWSPSISCDFDATDTRVVTGIDVTRNNCRGRLPPEMGYLPSLLTLRMSKNTIGGSIPAEVGLLTSLSVVDLSSNELTGQIPPALNNLRDLLQIDLSQNSLSSTIPVEIFDLRFLKSLILSSNKLTGRLSESINKLVSLGTLDIRDNMLTGPIPITLDGTPTLDTIRLDYNKFTGSLPLITNALVAKRTISLSHNMFRGNIDIHPTFGQIDAETFKFGLQYVDISYNELSGPISALFGLLPTLRYMDMSGNAFNGTFPSNIAWPAMEFLAIASNELTGTIPIGLETLTYLDTGYNRFSEGIPENLCNYTNMQFLSLGNNPLQSTLPECLAYLPLRSLQLSNAMLNGVLPDAFGMLGSLEMLNLSGNDLQSTIPNTFGNMTTMKELHLESNKLTGTVPAELANMTDLEILHLEDNNLSGSLPSSLSALEELQSLFLRGNFNLRGDIPGEMCELTTLQLLSRNIGCGITCSCCSDGDICRK